MRETFQYPKEIYELPYDGAFPIRGLHYDIMTGPFRRVVVDGGGVRDSETTGSPGVSLATMREVADHK